MIGPDYAEQPPVVAVGSGRIAVHFNLRRLRFHEVANLERRLRLPRHVTEDVAVRGKRDLVDDLKRLAAARACLERELPVSLQFGKPQQT
jgi:hypothetical protein